LTAVMSFILEEEADQYATVALLMKMYLSIRRRRYLVQRVLTGIKLSSWRKLFLAGDDELVTGFDYSTFNRLLTPFTLAYLRFARDTLADTPFTNMGRSRALQPCDALGLVLVYLRSMMRQQDLSLIFGHRAWIFGSLALVEVLQNGSVVDARIQWLSIEFAEYAHARARVAVRLRGFCRWHTHANTGSSSSARAERVPSLSQ
jgi:hypothetical protein